MMAEHRFSLGWKPRDFGGPLWTRLFFVNGKVTGTLTKMDHEGNSAPRLLTLSFPGIPSVAPPSPAATAEEGCRTQSVRGGRIRFVAGISLVYPS